MNNQSIRSGFLWKFLERFLAQGISFVVSIVLARILTPNDFGVVAIVMIFVTLADVFVNSGFSASLIQKKDADSSDFSTLFFCSFTISWIIYFFIFLLSSHIASFYEIQELDPILKVFSLRIPMGSYNAIQRAFAARNMMFKEMFISTLCGTIISGFLGIFMACRDFGVWSLVGQYLGIMFVDTVTLYIILPWRLMLTFDFFRARRMMSFGVRVLLADLSGTFFGQLRNLLIGKMYNSSDLALYNRGQQVPMLLSNNLSVTIGSVLFPAMANIFNEKNSIEKYTKQAVRITAWMGFPVFVAISLISKELIPLLYSEKWTASIVFSQILAIGYGFGICGVIPIQALKAVGKGNAILALEFYKKPVFFILLIAGLSVDLIFVSITMVIYEIYGMAVNFIKLNQTINYPFKEWSCDIFKPFVSSFVIAFIVSEIVNFMHVDLMLAMLLKIIIMCFWYLVISKLIMNGHYLAFRNYLFK